MRVIVAPSAKTLARDCGETRGSRQTKHVWLFLRSGARHPPEHRPHLAGIATSGETWACRKQALGTKKCAGLASFCVKRAGGLAH